VVELQTPFFTTVLGQLGPCFFSSLPVMLLPRDMCWSVDTRVGLSGEY
jgi:hypothetical protein